MGSISFRDVRKSYRDLQVVHGIDLEVADGEFIVILGPSGCGKSTLLRMVAGLEEISGGEIDIDGRVVNGLEPAQRDIAMVFQNYALYPHMSVYRNMAYGLTIKGMPKAEVETRVHKAAEILELMPFLARKPRELSGGQRQRVAMGRAIVREPSVFLFDEPLSNLDAKLRVQMRLEIHKLQAELGKTTLYVTHDQVEAMTLGHRIVVMNAGRAEQIGTPADVYERPATTFVAGFIGTPPMSLLQGVASKDGHHVDLPGGLRVPTPLRLASGRPVVAGVRPENVDLDPEGPIELKTDLVEVLGADQIAHLRADGVDLPARLPRHQPVRPGELVRVSIAAHDVRLFDPETGQAI
ncbi:sn-glycerol-3-phosphate ABC transporter ATP-binding protein UgpC [Minwuia thermotolerans]|uniref:sn-glycerol-3-phosphate ABC transporter ATP-binding protein UgpC n=1 Tax=Minwuia thermotolerans TaxID=2056226 RepID=A0A2M9G1R8_9PROT|nr:sn-glycerol-3-phosphate ABC transporter ATP-binding protein UgpC [Minwuia thermotolerans]PJK29667.1 sn-glycerol-3-phosphate ABC transporter ATP-binding protein UgpC [Minwuia thermotolerans]